MRMLLSGFVKYINTLKNPTKENLNTFLSINIKEVVILLLGRHKEFSRFLLSLLPGLFCELLVYRPGPADNNIKYHVSVNKEKILPHLEKWILNNYTVEEFDKICGNIGKVNHIIVKGTVVKINNIDDYTKLINLTINEHLTYDSISVIKEEGDGFLVFFG